MFIVEVDRPGQRTPALFDGFRLERPEQIEWLRRVCEYLYIDVPDVGLSRSPLAIRQPPGFASKTDGEAAGSTSKVIIRLTRATPYEESSDFVQELPRAVALRRDARAQLDQLLADARRGATLDLAGARAVVEGLTESIVRNPNALTGLTQLKRRDEYTAIHCLNVCIIALGFARHLNLEEEAMLELGTGALLHDIGKMRLPPQLLDKPGRLTAEEFDRVKRHPAAGVDVVQASGGLPPSAMDILFSHHERINSSGYPRGVSARTVSLFAKMVALADYFDAVTSHRPYSEGLGPSSALHDLYNVRGTQFDALLVDEFIQYLGVYPVGSVVELQSGEVGIVSSVNRQRRLKPVLTLILDAQKRPLAKPRVVDLADPPPAANGGYTISRSLEPESHGIDLHHFLAESIPQQFQSQAASQP